MGMAPATITEDSASKSSGKGETRFLVGIGVTRQVVLKKH